MISFDSSFSILIGLDPIDFRAGINRLSSIAQTQFEKNPRDRFIFVFRNKRKTDIKLIGYDGNGFFMGHKRLSKGKLKWWPRTEGESLSIDSEQLVRLLKGVDPRGGYHPDWSRIDDHGEQRRAHYYDWQGHSPIHLHIYLLQRFICHRCKSYFTAPSPIAESAKTVDDSGDKVKVTKCNRNALANAVVACLRFMFGIPFYRLAKIQDSLGIGLPEANQYAMVEQVYNAACPVYEQLIFEAAQGSLIMADDTAIKILDWLSGKGPPTKTTGEPRKTAQTSAVVSRSAEGNNIVLYLTGEKQAGKNIEEILSLRLTESGVPIYMCDGLGANLLSDDYDVIQVHCLDHGRRQFYDLQSSFPTETEFVLEKLKQVYKADKDAKKQLLDPDERMKHHQKHSAKAMAELGEWMVKGLENGDIEENSALGGAVKYMLKRWTELNEFMHTPGVPLSNEKCEQVIKKIITHRKNSLFYKTAKGANVGDVIQSLIATCQELGVSPFKYLAWLQENKAAVKKSPEAYLPWCYSA